MNPAPAHAKDSLFRRFDADDRAYFAARLVLVGGLIALFALGIMGRNNPLGSNIYLAALGLLLVSTFVFFYMVLGTSLTTDRAMMILLLPDLIAASGLTYLGKPYDAFYPAILMMPIFYALVVRKREAWLVGAGAATAYVIGLLFIGPQTTVATTYFAFKAGIVLIVAFLVANTVDKQRFREDAVAHAATETEHLNAQLRGRVHELQAVSDISEIIHSSLDFDRVGPEVLEIVAKAIGVTTCCLFVIDKTKSETVFSASKGTTSAITDPLGVASYGEADDHLTCTPVFDHDPTMVLFCTTPESLANLSEEERLVLGAVASELVVAVENSRLYKLTSRLAITDELTGLANYRHLQRRLDEELARARRYGKHLSLLMLDADDFKQFNDSQGHVAGDVALAELGPIMKRLVREVDVVARYGGEEFSVVLPETDAAGAYVVAEKIREAVELHAFADADGQRKCSLTLSIGLATYPTHASDKDSLLREADDALYHAKNHSKNRVRAPLRSPAVAADLAEDSSIKTDEWTGA